MLQALRVSDNARFLVREDGCPFFYLGDTAWELFHRLDEAAVRQYLCNRAGKGFSVIQSVVLSEVDGIGTPNAYGHLPLVDRDPARPNEAYFRHVDWAVDCANAYGLYVAMLPCWGHYVYDSGERNLLFEGGRSPVVFNSENAFTYGEFLGRRYRNKGILWILGGDRPVEGVEHVWEAMANGIKKGDGGRNLISFHPYGGCTSSTRLHHADWLDFNMIQSGHRCRFNPNHLMVHHDYQLDPVKPVIDSEPCYEDIPIAFNPLNGHFDDYDCRVAAYWGVFAGGCGHTYGSNAIWQMYEPGREPLAHARSSWQECMNLPGSYQMRHLRALLESRPYLSRIPDQSIVYDANNPQNIAPDYQVATRDGTPGKEDATWLMVYRPLCCWLSVDTSCLAADRLRSWWFDPVTATPYASLEFENPRGRWSGDWHAMPWRLPTERKDWVLVIDDASRGYPPPGVSML